MLVRVAAARLQDAGAWSQVERKVLMILFQSCENGPVYFVSPRLFLSVLGKFRRLHLQTVGHVIRSPRGTVRESGKWYFFLEKILPSIQGQVECHRRAFLPCMKYFFFSLPLLSDHKSNAVIVRQKILIPWSSFYVGFSRALTMAFSCLHIPYCRLRVHSFNHFLGRFSLGTGGGG